MFAGIGGFRTGLTRAGGFRCVGHCEIDKYANASYDYRYDLLLPHSELFISSKYLIAQYAEPQDY